MAERTVFATKTEEDFQSIDIPRDDRGRIRWRLLEDQGLLGAVVLAEATGFIQQGNDLTRVNLSRAGKFDLLYGIVHYYPGGFSGLKVNLGVPSSSRPSGFWRELTNIEHEGRRLDTEGSDLKQRTLVKAGLSSFVAAVAKYYPDGMVGLRRNLGLKIIKKPGNYWTKEMIFEESKGFLDQEGKISARLLFEGHRNDLLNAILRHYPGGIRQLKQDLGLGPSAKPYHYWTPEEIRKAALAFLGEEEHLTTNLLARQGRGDLRTAIGKFYPGKMTGLKRDLGLDIRLIRKKGYWTSEVIEKEAWEFFQQEGLLTRNALQAKNRYDLWGAIRAYPGRIRALRAKLGLSDTNKNSVDVIISPDEANEQLRRLLEE
ncbi:hypothetical protein HYU92_02810 [Candidatus Curtissbacteria bacterium]|nr:hypothetical protein [Candidatus Curtissbacteria bacterium]